MRTVLRWLTGLVVVAHGLIHAMGAIKGFGWADVAQLKEPISTSRGFVVSAGVLLCASVSRWWVVGAFALVVSQATISTSWSDAKAGTMANAVLLLAVAYGFSSQGPWSFRTEYRDQVKRALSRCTLNQLHDANPVTEADLAKVPEPVAAYLRRSGAVGQPRVRNFRAKVHGRFQQTMDELYRRTSQHLRPPAQSLVSHGCNDVRAPGRRSSLVCREHCIDASKAVFDAKPGQGHGS